jgi:L-fuconate dehydratase
MAAVITAVDTVDVRFPTSRDHDGSDAMHPDPDYSAAYVVVRTSADDGLEGHGFCFTIGRGTEVEIAAVEALRPLVVGLPVEAVCSDMGAFWRRLTRDSQLRWLGPEKGVIHMATAAIVNAMWDLCAKRAGKPLWKLLADMSPEQVVSLVDFRYLNDSLTASDARAMLEKRVPTKEAREEMMRRDGFPAYTTSAGWLGYSDDKVRRLVRDAIDRGFTHVKLKVGRSLEDDMRRMAIARAELGPSRRLMIDANQIWEVDQAIENIKQLARFQPWWVEEPTSPDDILGHARIARAIAPIGVATGEHVHNRVMFKQFFSAGAISFCQVDACRLGGVNEVVAVLLLAAKHGVPVCPHAGGVGLCELVQHLAMFDFIAVSGSLEGRVIEYVDHLHEHFLEPAVVRDGRYTAPTTPGYSSQMRPESLAMYAFPYGSVWTATGSVAPSSEVLADRDSRKPEVGGAVDIAPVGVVSRPVHPNAGLTSEVET